MLPFDEHDNILKTKFESASNPIFCFVLSYDHVNICFILIWILIVTLVAVIGRVVTDFIMVGIDVVCASCSSTASKRFCLQTVLLDLRGVRSLFTFLFKVKTIFWIISISFLCFNNWSWFSLSYLTRQHRHLLLILHRWLLFSVKIQIIWNITIEKFTLRFSLRFLFLKISILKFIFLIRTIELSLLTNSSLIWVLLSRFSVLWLLESC